MVNYCASFNGSLWIYLYIYGTFRSFSVRKLGLSRVLFYVWIGKLAIPIKLVLETAAVVWGITAPKHKFFVVKKDSTQNIWIFTNSTFSLQFVESVASQVVQVNVTLIWIMYFKFELFSHALRYFFFFQFFLTYCVNRKMPSCCSCN